MVDEASVETGTSPGARESWPRESLKGITRVNRPVYGAVVVILGVTLLIGVGGWRARTFTGRIVPDGLGVIIGTVAGGLVRLICGKET
jgi:hypothetical protein